MTALCGQGTPYAQAVDVSSAGEILGLAAAIVGIGGGAVAAGRGTAHFWRRTAGSRRALARSLHQLGGGTTLRWVEDRLGTPAFVREFPVLPGVRELMYHSRHAWIQVLADERDAVVRFSITVTDPRFRLQVRDLTGGQLTATLGRSTFAATETQAGPQGVSLMIGANRYEYAEAYWFGNPGGYQWYVLSHNDASAVGTIDWSVGGHGSTSFQTGMLESADAVPLGSVPQPDELARFRSGTTINTLTILGPSWSADGRPLGQSGLAAPRGPDASLVRVIVPDARELRRRRRRTRRWNRQVQRATRQEEISAPESRPVQPTSSDASQPAQFPGGNDPQPQRARTDKA